MVDGKTYECVKSFCYLGDTLDGDGGVELVAEFLEIVLYGMNQKISPVK